MKYAFIIIDYKGGGVALAFENKELGRNLPHIAGTITNLDTVEMHTITCINRKRIKNEGKQAFNKASRDYANESTYRYLQISKII